MTFYFTATPVFYLCVSCTGIAPPEPGFTARVFQAETGFVSLCHFTPGDDVQQVVVTEGVHAVEMSESAQRTQMNKNFGKAEMPLRPQLLGLSEIWTITNFCVKKCYVI